MWNNLIVYIILVQLWVAGEEVQPSSGHMCKKRPIIPFRGHEDSPYCIDNGRTSAMLVSERNLSITKKVLSDDIDDIQDPRYHIISAGHSLQRPGRLYVLGMPPRGDVRVWTPRARALDFSEGLTCARDPGGLQACHGAESTRNDPGRKGKDADGPKNTFIHSSINMMCPNKTGNNGWWSKKRDHFVLK